MAEQDGEGGVSQAIGAFARHGGPGGYDLAVVKVGHAVRMAGERRICQE